jgi:Protein of unknown function (DUF2914)
MKTFSVSLLLVLLMLAFGSVVQAATLSVAEMAITTKISKQKPIDSVHSISSRSVKVLYCFVRTASEESVSTTIHHVWIKDGVVVFDKELPVKGRRWRTTSSVKVDARSVGSWKVEVRDQAGQLIRSESFRVN